MTPEEKRDLRISPDSPNPYFPRDPRGIRFLPHSGRQFPCMICWQWFTPFQIAVHVRVCMDEEDKLHGFRVIVVPKVPPMKPKRPIAAQDDEEEDSDEDDMHDIKKPKNRLTKF
eukprot:TRINITY_DN5999_c0_g1_i1.p1 TRINITY_DN5999_c0_g1~~TRINITY_DN5999_c0_g1_i1.p1  ORF type:complete len:114 (-),score=17.30 TRINITY_DN5999_c0_g1_i1:50-391(-)